MLITTSHSQTVAIVGAGLAGLACAQSLSADGYTVRLFDKGRGPGGRMSTRRVETPSGLVHFDHGAHSFTARDQDFIHQLDDWAARGVAARWPGGGAEAWVGTPGMNALIKDFASRHDVTFGTLVRGIQRDMCGWTVQTEAGDFGPFDAVVIALPAEQAAPLLALHDLDLARQALRARSEPCWAGLFAFFSPLPFAADMVRDGHVIDCAARNSAKPGRSGPESWVVHATADWSRAHLEVAADDVADALLAALADLAGEALPSPLFRSAHRWRFARSARTKLGALWSPRLGLGACGDWLLGPRVECAWLSGRELARRMCATPVQAIRQKESVGDPLVQS